MASYFHYCLCAAFLLLIRIPVSALDLTILGGEPHQSIDGFGAATSFGDGGRHELFFSREKGIGLSLCRTPIPEDGSFPNPEIAKAAQAYGAKVWSSCWSPPARMKSNNSLNGGGYLLPGQYQAFADFLADYAERAKADGIDLYAISIQNEPNVTAKYSSCIWTAPQFHDFIRDNLGPTFRKRSLSTRIIAPEYSGWAFDLAEATMDDSISRNYTSILAAHTYKPDDKSKPYAKALTFGKRQWQTETSSLDGIDRSMANALRWMQEIHTMLTKTRINAWHYWLLDGGTKDNNEGLWAKGPTKRLYALGNYARFARPGSALIGVTGGNLDVLVTAFEDTTSSRNVSIVAVNMGAADVPCRFTLDQLQVTRVTPWVTSAQYDLARQQDIPVVDNGFAATLPAKSVTTFDGAGVAQTRLSGYPSPHDPVQGKPHAVFSGKGMPIFFTADRFAQEAAGMQADGRVIWTGRGTADARIP